MNARIKLLAVAIVASAGLAPAAHAAPLFVGFTCGLAAANDPTGLVNQNPTARSGVVLQYIYAGDTGSGPATSVTVTCGVQTNNPNHGGGGVAVSSTTAGPGGVLASTISYTKAPGDNLFVCTTAQVNTADGTSYTLNFDADADPTNGDQCALATTAENGEDGADAQAWDRETSEGRVG